MELTDNDETLGNTLRLIKAEWTGPIQARLDAASALHHRTVRYWVEGYEEHSWATREDLIEYYGGIEDVPGQITVWALCAECARIERNLASTYDLDEWGYVQEWPCPTAVALGVAEAPRVS